MITCPDIVIFRSGGGATYVAVAEQRLPDGRLRLRLCGVDQRPAWAFEEQCVVLGKAFDAWKDWESRLGIDPPRFDPPKYWASHPEQNQP